MAGAGTAASDWRTWHWYVNTTRSAEPRSTAGRPSSTPAGPTLSKSAHGDPDGLGFHSTAHSSSEGSSNCASSTVGVRTSWWCCSNVRVCTHQRAPWAVSSPTLENGVCSLSPSRMSVKMRKRRWSRPHAVRKPKDWPLQRPGDLVQVDTVDLRRHLQEQRKQFTARDMVSRWDVIEAHTRATSSTGGTVSQVSRKRSAPSISRRSRSMEAVEFAGQFEQECKARSIRLFTLPPRSPKLRRQSRARTENPSSGVLRAL